MREVSPWSVRTRQFLGGIQSQWHNSLDSQEEAQELATTIVSILTERVKLLQRGSMPIIMPMLVSAQISNAC